MLADIGATNARFRLSGGGGETTAVLASAEFSSLEATVRGFLDSVRPAVPPRTAAFAVAGPVSGDAVTLTNLGWRFSITELRRVLGLDRLEVVNDFTAVALALPALGPGDRRVLGGEREPTAGAALAVLGPGSGLGVSGLLPTPGGGWVSIAGEGGHVTLAATDEREAAILAALRRRLGPVSAECALSGPGLVNLYRAVAELDGHEAEPLAPAAITEAGLDGSCPRCREALALFAAFLGTVAGDLALTLGARGGVYLAGGIAPRLADFLEGSTFRRRFEDKGIQRPWLAAIPTWIITHPFPAFAGLATLSPAGVP